MKKVDLFSEIGNIDEKYINEVLNLQKRPKRKIKYSIIAAAAVLVCICSVLAVSLNKSSDTKKPVSNETETEVNNKSEIPGWYTSRRIESVGVIYSNENGNGDSVKLSASNTEKAQGITQSTVVLDASIAKNAEICRDEALIRVDEGCYYNTETKSYTDVAALLDSIALTDEVRTILDYNSKANMCVVGSGDSIYLIDIANSTSTIIVDDIASYGIEQKATISSNGKYLVLYGENYLYIIDIATKNEIKVAGSEVSGFTDGDKQICAYYKGIQRFYNCKTGKQEFDSVADYIVKYDVTPNTDTDYIYYITAKNKETGSVTLDNISANAFCRVGECVYTYNMGDGFICCRNLNGNDKFEIPLDTEFVNQVADFSKDKTLHFEMNASEEKDKITVSFSECEKADLESYFDYSADEALDRVRAYHNLNEALYEILLAEKYTMPDGTPRVYAKASYNDDYGGSDTEISVFIQGSGSYDIYFLYRLNGDSNMEFYVYRCRRYPNHTEQKEIGHLCSDKNCIYNNGKKYFQVDNEIIERKDGKYDAESEYEKLKNALGDVFDGFDDAFIIKSDKNGLKYVQNITFDDIGEDIRVNHNVMSINSERIEAYTSFAAEIAQCEGEKVSEFDIPRDKCYYGINAEYRKKSETLYFAKENGENVVYFGVYMQSAEYQDFSFTKCILTKSDEELKSIIDKMRGYTDEEYAEYKRIISDDSVLPDIEDFKREPDPDSFYYTAYYVEPHFDFEDLYFVNDYNDREYDILRIPALNLDTENARAFNEKIKNDVLRSLSKEYKITHYGYQLPFATSNGIRTFATLYDICENNGVVAVSCGLYLNSKYYYYDMNTDRELTEKEYLDTLGIDTDKLFEKANEEYYKAYNTGYYHFDYEITSDDVEGYFVFENSQVRLYLDHNDIKSYYEVLMNNDGGDKLFVVVAAFEQVKSDTSYFFKYEYANLDIADYENIAGDIPDMQFHCKTYTPYRLEKVRTGVYSLLYQPYPNIEDVAVGVMIENSEEELSEFGKYFSRIFDKSHRVCDLVPEDIITDETYVVVELVSVSDDMKTASFKYTAYEDNTKTDIVYSGTFTETIFNN